MNPYRSNVSDGYSCAGIQYARLAQFEMEAAQIIQPHTARPRKNEIIKL